MGSIALVNRRARRFLQHFQSLRATMVTFTIPAGSNGQPSPEFTVTSTQENLTRDQLLGFPAFNIWLSTLQRSLARQRNPNHAFHKKPYFLRRIDIQAVDYFGGGRLGFVKMKADVSNDVGEKLPGSVFLRGGSVGILVSAATDQAGFQDTCLVDATFAVHNILTRFLARSSAERC